jgi:hypothetical protein
MRGTITVAGQQILLPMIPTLLAQQIVGVQPMTDSVGEIFTMKASYAPQSKYKFSRANWYVAEFDDKYYFEVDKWCTEMFGPHPKNPDAWSRWIHKYENKIHLRDEKDYILFVLRWS